MTRSIYILLFAVLWGCTSKTSEVPVISFDKTSEGSISINDLVDSPREVRLETRDSALVNAYSQVALSNNYILIFTRKSIFEFRSDGTFLRELVKAGGGPNEFQRINSFVIDEKNERLIFDHDGSSRTDLMVYDLNSGAKLEHILKPLDKLPINEPFAVDNMVLKGDTLYCAPDRNYKGDIAYYLQRLSGEFLGMVPRDDAPDYGSVRVSKSIYLNIISDTLRYMSRDQDTLYSVEGTQRFPYAILQYEGKFFNNPDLAEIEGLFVSVTSEGPTTLILRKSTAKISRSSGGSSASAGMDASSYFVDKKDYAPVHISGIKMDGMTIPLDKVYIQSDNGSVILPIEAVDFKSMISTALEDESLSEDTRTKLQNLDSEITETDNPILIFGKMK